VNGSSEISSTLVFLFISGIIEALIFESRTACCLLAFEAASFSEVPGFVQYAHRIAKFLLEDYRKWWFISMGCGISF